jgi:hypothetical protein
MKSSVPVLLIQSRSLLQKDQQSDQLTNSSLRQAGIDLDLLDTLLAQPVAVRWRQHNAALALALRLETGKQSANARLHDTVAVPH